MARARRFSNDLTGTTKARRTPRARLEQMGREWALKHGGNATSTGNTTHDRACAMEVFRLTGRYPQWSAEQLKELGFTDAEVRP